jgi:plastocyanin
MIMEKKIQISIVLIAIMLLFIGCKKDDTTTSNPGVNEVFIQNMAFNPGSITVAAHTTIKWTNKDSNTHTVTGNTGTFNSGNLGNGGTFSFKFDSAGAYNYHCAIHSSMTATVIVQ